MVWFTDFGFNIGISTWNIIKLVKVKGADIKKNPVETFALKNTLAAMYTWKTEVSSVTNANLENH